AEFSAVFVPQGTVSAARYRQLRDCSVSAGSRVQSAKPSAAPRQIPHNVAARGKSFLGGSGHRHWKGNERAPARQQPARHPKIPREKIPSPARNQGSLPALIQPPCFSAVPAHERAWKRCWKECRRGSELLEGISQESAATRRAPPCYSDNRVAISGEAAFGRETWLMVHQAKSVSCAHCAKECELRRKNVSLKFCRLPAMTVMPLLVSLLFLIATLNP